MSLRRSLFVLATLMLGAASRSSAQNVDVIRGRVTGPEKQPIEGAIITVQTLAGGVSRQGRSDANGRYTVTFPGGDGDYMVRFTAIGFGPRQYELKRVADEDVLVADAQLSRASTTLDAVRVQGRDLPNRNDRSADVGGNERTVDLSGLPAGQIGDLAAMAASIPGILLVPGADGDPSGFSVLGLSPDQNATSLNGQNGSFGDLPRDAAIGSSVATSTYDASRGQFSGGAQNISLLPGTNFIARTSSLTVDAPALQWTDPAARSLGQEYSNLTLSGRVSGPMQYNSSFYNLSYQASRRSSDLQTLFNTDPLGLQSAGIAADSATRLLAILQQLHIPGSVGLPPSSKFSDNARLTASFDFAPPSSRAGSAYNLTLVGNGTRFLPIGGSVTELPAHTGDLSLASGTAQLRHSTYFGFGILSESSLLLTALHRESTPFLELPSGSVLINSSFADGTNGLKTVQFGGSTLLNSGSATSTIHLTNQLSWFSEDNQHRIKLTSDLYQDSYAVDQTTNALGSFAFNSLADLENGQPASFSRTLLPRTRKGSELVGAVALGDSWRLTPDLQVQYGLRVDGNSYSSKPVENPQVEQLFGVRNDYVPQSLLVSPRLGFTWKYGTAAQVGGFQGAFRGPRAVLQGGVGIFQGVTNAQLIGSAIDNTGLPGALQQVNCSGIAAPVPDWNAYGLNQGSIPTRCADGTTGSVFASSLPNVSLFAKDYAPPRRLGSNLTWTGAILANRLSATFDVSYGLTMNQPGTVDLNFTPVVRFTLPDEGGRPVYVQPSSVDGATGSIASRDARVSPLYNHVTENVSDLKTESKQFTASIQPLNSSSTLYRWSLAYVYSSVRDRVRGFGAANGFGAFSGANTAGNPFDIEWARSSRDSHHQIQYTLAYNFFDAVRVQWLGRFQSGTPFTPLVAGDVNGDGYSNDRAFVFNPATARDPAVGAAMKALIASSSDNVKSCLERQLGQVAARNSCEGPWTTSANLSVSFNPVKVRMPERATLSFAVSNPLGAADLLLHGQNNLRGWGQQVFPDQSLLYVRGFDATTQRYKYDVNQRFGSTSPSLSPFINPVAVTVWLRIDVGPTREKQSLTQRLNVGRRTEGTPYNESFLKLFYGNGDLINPMSTVLRQSDTLALTTRQADSLATMNRWYIIQLDSIWSPFAHDLAALPKQFDEGGAYGRYRRAREHSVDLLRKLAPQITGLLTAEQRRKLPPLVTSYLDDRYLTAIRTSSAGAAGSVFNGGGAGAIPQSGGGANIIIR